MERPGSGGQACDSIMASFITDQNQVLMDSDPGLRRRFSLVLQLEDYSAEELAEICRLVARLRRCTQMERARFAGRFLR